MQDARLEDYVQIYRFLSEYESLTPEECKIQ